jgi:hypothetical protein
MKANTMAEMKNTLTPELLAKMDIIDRLPQTGDKGIYLKQQLKDKLIERTTEMIDVYANNT